ncbi:class I SAM-dependent methyltransferase [Evansella sp. AB-rgal1]|uniref:class I SAM-dependent methyltransferase n=1 Tax=Evansella sp. AB-rgal1 TaxID=3242696 RepID=UPI00359F0DB1
MKFRESGMPTMKVWNSFFYPDEVIKKMGVNQHINTFIDIGCGYGTFLVPASEIIRGKAVGIDIDDKVLNECREAIPKSKKEDIDLIIGDVTEKKTIEELEKYSGTIDYISLFNMVHCEEPLKLLTAAYYLLSDNGILGITHWIQDDTPRGPSMKIRPTPNQIKEWGKVVNFEFIKEVKLPPYHFGIVFEKKKHGSFE